MITSFRVFVAAIVVVGAALFGPASASAAPTHIEPTAASLVASRPLLSWMPLAGESVSTIDVSRRPDVTPEGEFFDENRVEFDLVADGATSWQPTRRFYAGSYWWQVKWIVDDYSAPGGFTTPTPFVIPASVKANGVSIYQWDASLDDVTVAYISNVRYPVATCSVYFGTKLITRRAVRDDNYSSGVKTIAKCEVNVSKAYAGKRLKLVAVVKAGGKSSAVLRYFYGKRPAY